MLICVTLGCMFIGCGMFMWWWIRFMKNLDQFQQHEMKLDKEIGGEIIIKTIKRYNRCPKMFKRGK